MLKKNKKADLEISTLIEIIIFAAIFLIIILPLLVHMWGYFTEKPDSGTKKSLDALIIEANNLRGEREVPVYVGKRHILQTFPQGGPSERCNEKAGCICICVKEKGCTNNNLCKSLDQGIKFEGSYRIEAALNSEGKATLKNCLLKKLGDEISILNCASS